MALNDHLALRGLIDGLFQVKATQWSATFNSGAQRVDTLEGLAGKTPGAGSIEITGNWAVDIGGPEVDLFTYVAEGSYHELQIPVGTKSIISQGWFDTSGISQATNASTEMTGTFIGELQPLQ